MKPGMIPMLRRAVQWAEAGAAKGDGVGQWWQSEVYMTEGERVGHYGLAPGCGSSYCIAGWIVASHYGVDSPYQRPPDGLSGSMSAARVLLGLDAGKAGALFEAGNSIEDVRRIAEDIAGEAL